MHIFRSNVSGLYSHARVKGWQPRSCGTAWAGVLLLLCFRSSLAATFTVTTNADSGAGSLRQAIIDANAASDPDEIIFNLGGGTHTIQPLSPLPAIIHPVTIDGYFGTGASANTLAEGNDAVLVIELDGSSAGTGASGLTIQSGETTVRGLAINRFDEAGIRIDTWGLNHIEGNFIGTDIGGSSNAPNKTGIHIVDSPENEIGGTTPQERNVISGNMRQGILVETNSSATMIRGNHIGTDKSGSSPLDNGYGIRLKDAVNILIGGSSTLSRNVISGNKLAGVASSNSDDVQVLANYIGVAADSSSELGNTFGVFIQAGSGGLVGDGSAGAANIIAYNRKGGVIVQDSPVDGPATGHSIRRNSIYRNPNGLGIDLDYDGVTANDAPPDADIGANRRQNFPDLIAAERVGGPGVHVLGQLDSQPNTTFTIELFGNSERDPSGHGEGETYLGSFNLITDGGGHADFDQTLSGDPGLWVTATATHMGTKDTSEFSGIVAVTGETYVVTDPGDGGVGTLRYAIDGANSSAETDVVHRIEFNLAGSPPHAIDLATPLPQLNGRIWIDGFTQPGAVPGIPPIVIESTPGISAPPLQLIGNHNTLRGLTIRGDSSGSGIGAMGDGSFVDECWIGVNDSGTSASGTLYDGIDFIGVRGGSIRRSIIGGGPYDGVFIQNCRDIDISENSIGVGSGGENIGAGGAGTSMFDTSDTMFCHNESANNGYEGVNVGGASAHVEISRNSLHDNGWLGIDVVNGGFGVGPGLSDFQDADTGVNGLQNVPVIQGAGTTADSIQIVGTFNSVPERRFTLEFFDNLAADPSGYGEGRLFIGDIEVETDANGDAGFNSIFPHVPLGGPITGTATDWAGNSSEFGLAINPFERPAITDLYQSGSVWYVECTTIAGRTHTIEATPGLVPDDWQAGADPFIGSGGTETRPVTLLPGSSEVVDFRLSVEVP